LKDSIRNGEIMSKISYF